MATIIELADAIVTELNTHTFSQPVTAARYYLPTFDLQEMHTLHVSVVPTSVASQELTRARKSYDYTIDVGVQQKTDLNLGSLDVLVDLAEEIADHLDRQPLAAMPEARCVEITTDPVFAPEHLNELHQFTSIITVTYRLWK